MKIKKNSGISLIVLIITVIVVIILATVLILTLSKNNPIQSAKEATFKEDIRNFQTELKTYISKDVLKDIYGSRETIDTGFSPEFEDVKKYISSFSPKYETKVGIEDDTLVYYKDKVTENEEKWLKDLDIKAYCEGVAVASEEFFEWDNIRNYRINRIKSNKLEEFEQFINNNKGVLVLPDRCTEIGQAAFYNKQYIKKLRLNDRITSIGEETFALCYNIEQIYLPDTLRYLYFHTFFYCKKLKKIDLPENLYSIGWACFNSCESLESIVIPPNVTRLGQSTFSNCKSLKKIVLSKEMATIEGYNFTGCTSLEEILVDPENENFSSQDGVLYNKDKTELVIYPLGKKDETYATPSSLKRISNDAFKQNNNIKNLNLNYGVENIGSQSFFDCKTLENITIPNTLVTIGNSAFYFCENLKKIIIPINTTTVGNWCFANDKNLSIYCEATSKPEGWDKDWNVSYRPVTWGYTGN